jgi:hypothetical protein
MRRRDDFFVSLSPFQDLLLGRRMTSSSSLSSSAPTTPPPLRKGEAAAAAPTGALCRRAIFAAAGYLAAAFGAAAGAGTSAAAGGVSNSANKAGRKGGGGRRRQDGDGPGRAQEEKGRWIASRPWGTTTTLLGSFLLDDYDVCLWAGTDTVAARSCNSSNEAAADYGYLFADGDGGACLLVLGDVWELVSALFL